MIEPMSDAASFVVVRYRVRPSEGSWVLPEGKVPESVPHDRAADHLVDVLRAWASSLERPVRVARNLGIRWLERAPRIGIDPDVCVLDPAPAEFDSLGSLCLWKPGHAPPSICFEIVSRKHPHKDYKDVHERYAALGARELVVFDPLLAGPASLGGPLKLQLWRRDACGAFERVAAGDGPLASEVLGCWISASERGELVFSADSAGEQRWLTGEERERAEKERERAERERAEAEREHERAERERAEAERERERAEKEQVLARLAELEKRVGKAPS